MLVRASRRLLATSSVFPGIEFTPDDPVPYTPAPLRPESDDAAETIEAQSKGSARRLLKDRYVDDGGYLQSRSPFPLKAPRWEHLDAGTAPLCRPIDDGWLLDRPEMTSEGALWEDMNHFVDYLTCRDVALAYELNEMLLHHPKEALQQFDRIVQLLKRPLCNHEVLGRGYVFSREPVLSPSDYVGRLVLARESEKLQKAMQYLYIWDSDYLDRQLNHVMGVDLEILYKSGFLLVDSALLLHGSAGWTEARFVEVLQEMAVFLPKSASVLHLLGSPFVLVELLLHHDRTIQRFLELQRGLLPGFLGMELLQLMGRCASWCLHRDEDVFQGFLKWLPVMLEQQIKWKDALRLCHVFYLLWEMTEMPLDDFLIRSQKLHQTVPSAFINGLMECVDKEEAAWKLGSLYGMIQNCDEVIEKLTAVDVSVKVVFEHVPYLLALDASLAILQTNLQRLTETLVEWPLTGPNSVEALVKLQPHLLLDPAPGLELFSVTWPTICDAFTSEERVLFQQQCNERTLLEAVQKLNAVLLCIQTDHGFNTECSFELLKHKIDRVRQWRRHTPVPVDLITFMEVFSVSKLAELVAMDINQFETLETSLFILFGNSPVSIFTSLISMPELLTKPSMLEDAILVSRCRKVHRECLRKDPFRVADAEMKLLINTISLTRTRTELPDCQGLDCLEAISEKGLLGDGQISPRRLAQFCILCAEHPGAWMQFEELMERVHHPLLAEARPTEMHQMKREAFRAILCAPEIFLIRFLWDQMMQYLVSHQWTFAGLDVQTVYATEPVLFYYAVEEKWRQVLNRNAEALLDAPLRQSGVKRRGKSIVKL